MSAHPVRLLTANSAPLALMAALAGALVAICSCAQTQPPSDVPSALAPSDVQAVDDPGDESGAVAIITWSPPSAPPEAGRALVGYRLYRAADGGEFKALLERITEPTTAEGAEEGERFEYKTNDLWTWDRYRFRVAALYAPEDREHWYMQGEIVPEPDPEEGPAVLAEEALSDESGPVQTVGRWYKLERTNVLVCFGLYGFFVVWYILRARRGSDIYIRPIAGIEAIDEAIGRATEMGKSILYVAGLHGLGSISTITSMMILGRVARRTAEYETPLLVPSFDPLVMLAAREIVKEAYLDAGKPDAYREQDIFFVTDRQFAYVAAVDGIMMRERPAANLYMGYFYAEALILAETGADTGAIQIAGTDADTQIPFFVTACDFTLMGEELYAATAYLSREPMLLAQLKAQDVGKAFAGGLVALGAMAASVAVFLAEGGAGVIQKCIDFLGAG